MAQIYKVTFNIDAVYGYIAYDEAEKTISVSYPDKDVCTKIIDWLQTEHTFNVPDENTTDLTAFSPKTFLATNSKKDFQTVLTRIWEDLDVHIDWSFPADCI